MLIAHACRYYEECNIHLKGLKKFKISQRPKQLTALLCNKKKYIFEVFPEPLGNIVIYSKLGGKKRPF